MADKTKKQSGKRRTEVKDLPKKKSRLTKEEQKKVKGGGVRSFYIDAAKPLQDS
jgi:hypothetical protein